MNVQREVSKGRILVVEDDDRLRQVICRFLSKSGFDTTEAASGEVALDELARARPSAVLLDIHMRGMSGHNVLSELRSRHSGFELPVLVLSGDSSASNVIEALDGGANDFIAKPFDFELLGAKLQIHLERCARNRARALMDTVPIARATHQEQSRAGRRTSRRSVQPEALLSSRYSLERTIGKGAFGVVFSGTHKRLGRRVAVKFLDAKVARDPEQIAAFQREGALACSVQHPNAVQVHDCGVARDGSPYLVMELLEGQTLADELAARGALSVARATSILGDVAACLTASHRAGVSHLDVKPNNIVLHREGDAEIVKLVDFGAARLASAVGCAPQVGTPLYMAPERFTGDSVAASADIYSLGCVLYECAVGQPPHQGRGDDPVSALAIAHNLEDVDFARMVGEWSGAAVDLVAAMLAVDPLQRPTAKTVLRALRQLHPSREP